MTRSLKRSLLGRTAFLGLLLPCLYFGTASATFLFRVHSDNASPGRLDLDIAPPPSAKTRLLVFAPHPDDETLGCAGLIQQASAAGADVTVAFLTNGDGFRVAVERQFREIRIGPEHYVRFAALRQQETREALGNLGVQSRDIRFLGYPDRGLLPLWNDHWSPEKPYRSPYTHKESSPYPVAYQPNAPYCGQALLGDIERILRESRPTDIYVTHPLDDHPDHTAASSFVTLALQNLRERGEPWAKSARLRYYIVHRGDWPVPQGLYKSDKLHPPSEMLDLDTHWESRPLTGDQTEAKNRSILSYHSQTAVMKRFLVSFARSSEICGEIETAKVPRAKANAGGSLLLQDWTGIKPVLHDPVNDSLLRDFQSAGDVRAVFVARDSSRLHFRVAANRQLSRRVEFRVRLRYFGDPNSESGGGLWTASLRPGGAVIPAETPSSVHSNVLDFSVPLRDLGYTRRIAVNIDTFFAGIQVDRTGYRFLDL